MAPFGKIYSYPGNFRAQWAQVVAAINGLEVPLAEDFEMAVTNKTPEFLAKFPMGKIPALECADGFCPSEGAAIAMYLASCGPAALQLLGPPTDAKTRACIAEWSCFADNELGANVIAVGGMAVWKYLPYEVGRYTAAVAGADRALKRLEVGLRDGRKFLLGGDQLTLADVMLVGALFFAAGFFIDAETRKNLPAVAKYMESLAALPEFKKAFGEVKMTETRVLPPQ